MKAGSLSETTEVAARTLGVARASVWTFTQGRDAIECLDLFDEDDGEHIAGATLARAGCPAYFDALEQTDVIPAVDAQRDPRTCELTDSYLKPIGVGALLDAPIHADGGVVGVLCLEHRPGPRTWTPYEQGFAVALANLVPLRLAQQARRESERRSQLVVDAVRDGILGLDLSGRTVFENPAALAMLGWEAGELIGQPCHDIARLLPESVLYAEEAVARVVIDDREHRSEGWEQPSAAITRTVTVADRRIGFIEVGYRPGGHVDGGAVFLTEEHDLLDAVATHIRRMLRHREMADSLARSERLRGVGELTGGVAHDFNNLLQVILGNAELLSTELAADAGLRQLADMTRVAAERGAELTSRLLAFARQQPLDPRPTDVDALLAAMQPLLRRTLGEQLEVVLSFRSGGARALVDPAQLESAVLNLCINARDAMPGGGTLTLGTTLADSLPSGEEPDEACSPTPQVVIVVADTGIGMTPETRARAFDPFFTTKDVGRGSGLGLSMVYGFARQPHGNVTLESAPNEGTTVRLYLPAAGISVAPTPGTPVDAADATGGDETILLVEDDDLVRAHVRGQLDGLGYSVVTAASGAEALSVLDERHDIDLLFTDIVMPGRMSGRDLAEAARPTHPMLPVLFTSGFLRRRRHPGRSAGRRRGAAGQALQARGSRAQGSAGVGHPHLRIVGTRPWADPLDGGRRVRDSRTQAETAG